MKRETFRHPKTLDLAARLQIPVYAAVGLLGSLWNWVPDVALAGDIGRWNNGVIANALGWTGDADTLIEALVASGWLDHDDTYRLVVHDWGQHCENWVRAKAEKAHVTLLGARSPTKGQRSAPSPQQPVQTLASAPLERPLESAVPPRATTPESGTEDSNLRAGLKSASPPRDQTKPNLSNPPPPPSGLNTAPVPGNGPGNGPPAGVPKGWEEEEAGLRRLGVNLAPKAIRSAIEHGFTRPQVQALIAYLESKPVGCTAPHGAIFNRLVEQAADAVHWDCDQNWPWSTAAGESAALVSPYQASPAVEKARQRKLEEERRVRAAKHADRMLQLEVQFGDQMRAMEDEALLALLPDAVLRRQYNAKGRDSPEVRLALLTRLEAAQTAAQTPTELQEARP